MKRYENIGISLILTFVTELLALIHYSLGRAIFHWDINWALAIHTAWWGMGLWLVSEDLIDHQYGGQEE